MRNEKNHFLNYPSSETIRILRNYRGYFVIKVIRITSENDFQKSFAAAEALYKNGQFIKAEEVFLSLLDGEDNNSKVLLNLGRTALYKNELKVAE